MNATLKIVRGQFLDDFDPIGHMDTYITLQTPQGEFKTKVAHGQGKTPIWNDIFKLNQVSQIQLSAYDDDPGVDDYLGQTVINLPMLVQTGQANSWQPLYDKKMKQVGQLLIEISP